MQESFLYTIYFQMNFAVVVRSLKEGLWKTIIEMKIP